MAKLFGLTAVGLTATAAEVARGEYLQGKLADGAGNLAAEHDPVASSRPIPSST